MLFHKWYRKVTWVYYLRFVGSNRILKQDILFHMAKVHLSEDAMRDNNYAIDEHQVQEKGNLLLVISISVII